MPSLETQIQPVYKVYDKTVSAYLSFHPMTLEKDLERIHRWMNHQHVIPFWQMAWPIEKIEAYLKKVLADSHQTAYIGCIDNKPMSYWECYWVIDDILGKYYPAERADQGIHLLIGEPYFLGKGLALPFLRAMTMFQFQHTPTTKTVTEPDARNAKMIHIFKKCGFEFQKNVDLPGKTGALMFCDRQKFKNMWSPTDLYQ
ncbi:GNAT family N-acetyltransferase [Synechococcus sp. BDU 130192]|uniref:GNAT family N-acetyltransferase n=1 Tax=Synechococcus sp. BDU 130192 TaxID=2042059 RepID=UPI000C07A20B|nr:GNAT family N-acetyltransferase [Synechococcus sp. BDU 130192]